MHTNYVISLSSASQRREHIIKEFGKHHIPFEFYDAITHQSALINSFKLIYQILLMLNFQKGRKRVL